ncbi:uncharacterized protein LOC125493389 [Beta vulgaris subsp. vulgaris]|uniref:uncharacterized protein LOC125493389 n=1 Tax=Beta vulgaris subsp. vulgaris TaxID=3555 RepID=UPI00053F5438|nr:uncharacterized protein LOC125493389 [Beta vulgaris subsp. vulgaris]
MAADKNTYHSAFTLNIKQHLPLTLNLENVHYSSWAELFKITARANQVLDHIIPPAEPPTITDKELWGRLDAIVLQWIYGTITEDLMLTILEPGSTAQQAWERLRDIFQDNKHSRAVYLENQFSHTNLENFKNVSAYCQKLKMLSDQLAGVGSPVSNQRLVLQLVAGLTDAYDHVASFIQQSDPLPPFYKARSMLILEETRKSQQIGTSANVLIASADSAEHSDEPSPDSSTSANPRHHSNSPSRGRGRGGRGGSNHRGGSRGRGRGRQALQSPRYPPPAYYPYGPWGYPPPLYGPPSSWASAPCPYPVTAVRPTQRPSPGPGVLGPRPAHAYAVLTEPSHDYTATDIDTALHTMTLSPPDDSWYMDTGATSHMTGESGPSDGDYSYEM